MRLGTLLNFIDVPTTTISLFETSNEKFDIAIDKCLGHYNLDDKVKKEELLNLYGRRKILSIWPRKFNCLHVVLKTKKED